MLEFVTNLMIPSILFKQEEKSSNMLYETLIHRSIIQSGLRPTARRHTTWRQLGGNRVCTVLANGTFKVRPDTQAPTVLLPTLLDQTDANVGGLQVSRFYTV